jgi:hypothetical protein
LRVPLARGAARLSGGAAVRLGRIGSRNADPAKPHCRWGAGPVSTGQWRAAEMAGARGLGAGLRQGSIVAPTPNGGPGAILAADPL